MSSKKLSRLQQEVYNVLVKKKGKDVTIEDMHDAAYGATQPDLFAGWTSRQIQQRMGPLISRINAKLPRHKVVPGELKRTYRLVPTTKAK